MNWKAVAIIAITMFVTALPAQAYKFSPDADHVLTGDELYVLVNGGNNRPFTLLMQPSADREPRDSFYKLCAWAHQEPYRIGVEPKGIIYQCICQQLELNWWVQNPDLIYPYEWYRIILTAEGWRNVIVQMMGTPDGTLLSEQVRENTEAIIDLKRSLHGTHLEIEDGEAIADLRESQQRNARHIEENSEAIVALGGRTELLERGIERLGDEIDMLRHADVAADNDLKDLRDEVRALAQSSDEPHVNQLSPLYVSAEKVAAFLTGLLSFFVANLEAILILLLLVVLVWAVFWVWRKSVRRKNVPADPAVESREVTSTTAVADRETREAHIVESTPTAPAAPAAQPVTVQSVPEETFTTTVVDENGRERTIAFAPAAPDAHGRARVLSPWTRNPILRTRAPLHAEEQLKEKGLPN